ncbi:MAG: hypothetical protein R3320_00750 [Nitriliruptorales bacterium]|nr:hypothetical protein [Nitriliruptorales bacterium]
MMNALYVTTLVAVGLLIVAVAVTLLIVTYLLWRTRSSLRDVADAIATIADRSQPLGPALTQVNEDLLAVRDALVAAVPTEERPPEETPELTDVGIARSEQ